MLALAVGKLRESLSSRPGGQETSGYVSLGPAFLPCLARTAVGPPFPVSQSCLPLKHQHSSITILGRRRVHNVYAIVTITIAAAGPLRRPSAPRHLLCLQRASRHDLSYLPEVEFTGLSGHSTRVHHL